MTVIRMATGVGLLVYLGVSGSISWYALGGLAYHWEMSLAALCLLFVVIGLTSWRLCLLLEPRGFHVSLGSSIRLTLIGIYFNLFLPGGTGGDIVRIYYATKGNHGRRTEIATIILLDRLFGTFAIVLLPILIVPFFPRLLHSMKILRVLLGFSAAIAAAMLTGLLICFVANAGKGSILFRLFEKLPLGKYANRIYNTVHAYRHHGGTLVGILAISMAVHALLVAVMLLLVQLTSRSGISGAMAVLIPLGLLANSLPVTPSGLGVGEVAFGKLFYSAGFSGGIEALLGWRILMAFTALAGLVLYLQGRHEFLSQAGESTHAAGRDVLASADL